METRSELREREDLLHVRDILVVTHDYIGTFLVVTDVST